MAANTGVLGELGTVVRANVTEVLERAEDPEKLVDLIFRDMAEALREAKAQVLSSITQDANKGALSELGPLVRANVTQVLERAEDPEKLVDLIFRDMTEALREARAQVLEQQRGGEARTEAA